MVEALAKGSTAASTAPSETPAAAPYMAPPPPAAGPSVEARFREAYELYEQSQAANGKTIDRAIAITQMADLMMINEGRIKSLIMMVCSQLLEQVVQCMKQMKRSNTPPDSDAA